MLIQYFSLEAFLAVCFSFIGCFIRYGELYKHSLFKTTWFIIDSLISVFLGYITYLELVVELRVHLVHSYLACMVVGNIGSKTLTLIKYLINSSLEKHHITGLGEVLFSDEANKHDDHNNDSAQK